MISINQHTGDLPVVSITDESDVVIEVMGSDRRKRKTTSSALVKLLDGALEETRRQRAAVRAAYAAGAVPMATLYDDVVEPPTESWRDQERF